MSPLQEKLIFINNFLRGFAKECVGYDSGVLFRKRPAEYHAELEPHWLSLAVNSVRGKLLKVELQSKTLTSDDKMDV